MPGDSAKQKLVYEVVQHDGGFAYKVGNSFSEPFQTHDAARAAAEDAAARQELEGETTDIEYETPDGKWRLETANGDDRPDTEVEDTAETDLEATRPVSRPLRQGEL